jgi:hypothetical protein
MAAPGMKFATTMRRAGVRPWAFALVAYLLAALAVPLLLQLRLKPGLASLLPSDKPSVRDLETAGSRIGGLSTLTVALLSQDRDALQRFARDLVPRLRAIRGHGIRSVDWSVSAFADFVREHRELYADVGDLREVRDRLEDRLDYERSKASVALYFFYPAAVGGPGPRYLLAYFPFLVLAVVDGQSRLAKDDPSRARRFWVAALCVQVVSSLMFLALEGRTLYGRRDLERTLAARRGQGNS